MFKSILMALVLTLTACGSDKEETTTTTAAPVDTTPAPAKRAATLAAYTYETGVEPETGNAYVKGSIVNKRADLIEGDCTYSFPADAKFYRVGDRVVINDKPFVFAPLDGETMPENNIFGTWESEFELVKGQSQIILVTFEEDRVRISIGCYPVQ